jgi:type I restriction enzyme M protein
MLTDPKLRSQVDRIWDTLWTGGLSNPMDAIEQFSYLLFLKRLDELEDQKERSARRRGEPYTSPIPGELRWKHWTCMRAEDALDHLKSVVFPWFKGLGEQGSSFERYMQNAECKINRGSLLIEVCNLIDGMRITEQAQDVQGDLYEYLLSYLNTAGRSGQFRTPRHVIRMMVQMIDPRPGDRVADLAAGTCGFLVNAYQYILETHTPPDVLTYDEQGWPHNLTGSQLTTAQREHLQQRAFRGYDNDSGMTMLRIGSMNLMLHGIRSPHFFYMDTLSKEFEEADEYTAILMNPPFKGKVDKNNVSSTLPGDTTKSELLFLHLALRALDSGGRCAIIVPDGVLFGSSRAHVAIRKKLIEEQRLDGVVSMPGGVFKPYAGVSTAVLLFTKNATTGRIWYYDMAHDGFSLDDKREPVAENDIPDILECWRNRHDPGLQAARQARLEALREQAAPLKARRLELQGEINRLTFEAAIAPNPPRHSEERADARDEESPRAALDGVNDDLAALEAQIAPVQAQIDQLTRQFWVSKERVRENKYDLSASRYREVEQDEAYYEKPQVTMERLLKLEQVMTGELHELEELLR